MKKFDLLSIREYFPSIDAPSTSTWVFNQVKEIQKYGVNSIVVSPNLMIPQIARKLFKKKHAWKIRSSKEIEKYLDINVIRPPYLKLASKYFLSWNIINFSKCLLTSLNGFEYKLIHAHFGHAGICAMPLKLEKKVPLITSFYGFDLGSDKERLSKYYAQLAKIGELFLVLSTDMAKDLIELGFPKNKIVVHHLGVDTNLFNVSEKNHSNVFVFTVVATFEKRKGIHFVIEAFKQFLNGKSNQHFQLRIVGDGTESESLMEMAKEYQNIIFINNFLSKHPRQVVLDEMQKCDVLLLTSYALNGVEKEGTPVVLMEAQSCGKPCISTVHAGIAEVVLNGITGILVEEQNIQQIIDAMELLNKDEKLRDTMGKNAREHIEKNFNNERQVFQLNQIYREYL